MEISPACPPAKGTNERLGYRSERGNKLKISSTRTASDPVWAAISSMLAKTHSFFSALLTGVKELDLS